LPHITVPAPESGIVWEIGVRDGMAVNPNMTLFKLAGLGTVWVDADIPESQAGLARVGLPVEARAAAYPDHVFKGSISAILPELNPVTRSIRARIELANPGGMLKPGMFATVAFGRESGAPSLLVPAEAVIRTGKRDVVIVASGDGKFTPAPVEIGRESGEQVEIRKGLAPGQRVVVSGQFLVDSESSLKGVLARLAATGTDTQSEPPSASGAPPAQPMAMPMPPPPEKAGDRK
jgi:membrane fusion protein, copper/silver efflux system